MVVKKYLCAAPRPESWEEKAQALLQSFQGNVEKRDETLRKTLQQLQAIRTYERRTGPGRKSNAEHAIAFYEYVLGVGQSGDDQSDDDDEDEVDDDDQKQNGEDNNDKNDTGRSSRSTKNDKEEEDEEEQQELQDKPEEEEEKTIESMDSQEFLNQHNDACEVCNLGGDLLCCSTCSLVFHLACVRPKLEKLPVGDWSCAYCILATGGYKKHSKVWKAASAAVRHMERLRDSKQEDDSEDDNNDNDNENESEDDGGEDKNDEGKQTKETKPDGKSSHDTNDQDPDSSESVAETERHENISHEEEERGAVRRNSALSKIADALSPKLEKDTLESTGRGRRPRRQPILYDPQTGPDSRWKSDVTQLHLTKSTKTREENASGPDEEDDYESESQLSPKRRRRSRGSADSEAKESTKGDESPTDDSVHEKKGVTKKESGSDDDDEDKNVYWCNFCQDDPKVPICVFCACRVCFGKHDKDKILLCDQCDDEYHTFCLKPPLTTVPNTKKWFCPTCKAASSESSNSENKVTTRRVTSSPNKGTTAGAGTPNSSRASSSKKDSLVSSAPSTKSTSSVSSSNDAITPKKSRGRPSKIKTPPPPPTSESTGSPRKRGRPPKTTVVMTSPSPGDTPGRKRGRPPKNPSAATSSPPSPVRKKSATKPVSAQKRSVSPSTRKADVSVVTKKARTEALNTSSEAPPVETPQEPIKTSRSGRVVKRSSFHDEMEEGEQHLRSSRSKADADDEDDDDDEIGIPTQEIDETNDGALAIGDSINAEGTTSQDPSVADDEMSEDTIHERPVRTKVIDPPNTTMAVPEQLPRIPDPAPRISADITNPETSPRDPPATGSAVSTPSNMNITQEPGSTTTLVDKVECPRIEQRPNESTDAIPPQSTGKSMEAPGPTGKQATDKSSQAPFQTKQSPLPSTVPAPLPAIPPIVLPPPVSKVPPKLNVDVKALVKAAIAGIPVDDEEEKPNVGPVKVPRRKPGARECMQISRRFGVRAIPKKYMDTLLDYCTRGKVEHLIRMRERLDEHSRFLESQLAGLEALVQEVGETDVVVPPLPERAQNENQTNKPLQQQLSVKSSDDVVSLPTKSTSSTPMAEAAVAPKLVSTIPTI